MDIDELADAVSEYSDEKWLSEVARNLKFDPATSFYVAPPEYANDETAIAAGIPIGGLYRVGSALKICIGASVSVDWAPVKIGGGGFVSGLDIAADGTKVIRCDIFGAYRWDGLRWRQLITASGMPISDIEIRNSAGQGIYEIRIAPSNTSRFYAIWNGYLYRSDDSGTTWTRTAWAKVTDANAQGTYRAYGQKIAIDPVNADVVYAGSPGRLRVSTDAGETWADVTDLGTATGPGFAIAFDLSSATSSGRKQGIYVSRYGTGVYHSTNAGATWELTTGGPTQHVNMIVDGSGDVYLVNFTNKGVFKYIGGVWSFVDVDPTGNRFPWAIAIDPENGDRFVVANGAGAIAVSIDHAVTFTEYSPETSNRVATDIPWLGWTANNYFTLGQIAFDPLASNKLYATSGIGVWHTAPIDNPTSNITWTLQTIGVEELATNGIISVPGGGPMLLTAWDRPVFRVNNPNAFPSVHGPNNTYSVVHGWEVDYAKNDYSFIAGVFNSDLGVEYEQSGYSTDGGVTWNAFASKPASVVGSPQKIGGCFAVSTATNMVWFPSNNSYPYYTTDGGATWVQISIPGLDNIGWGAAYFYRRHIVAADHITTGTFYAFNYSHGFYKSTDGGINWTLMHAGAISQYPGYNAVLKSVPGISGHLFYTDGALDNHTLESPIGTPLYRSDDGGATWASVQNVLDVICIGFGKGAPGHSNPAIFIVGWVNDVYGIYRSDDDTATWELISTWPNDNPDVVNAVSGDMNNYGDVFVSLFGSGWAYKYGQIDTGAPAFSNVSFGTPDQAFATITWDTDEPGTSQVIYGETASYGSTTILNQELNTSHSVLIGGLAPGTLYHFAVISTDMHGNTATSQDYTFSTAAGAFTQRLVPVDGNTFYIISEHATLGAIAFRFQRNNAGDSSTPAGSIGPPFEPWRHTGTYELSSISSNPANPLATFSEDILPQDYFMKRTTGLLLGGSYHGGEVVNSSSITKDFVPVDISVETYGIDFKIDYVSTITWASGFATVDSSTEINANGQLINTMTFYCPYGLTEPVLGTVIGSGDYVEAGFVWGSATGTVPLLEGKTLLGKSTQVTLRNPTTGQKITIDSNLPGMTSYSSTFVMRETSPSHSRVRFQFANGTLGTRSGIVTTHTYENGATGATSFGSNLISNGDFSTGDLTAWTVSGPAATYDNGMLRIERYLTGSQYARNGFSATIGNVYYARGRVAIGFASAGIHVNSNTNGSLTSPPAPLNLGILTEINPRYHAGIFVADATTHYMLPRVQSGTQDGSYERFDDLFVMAV